MYDGKLLTVGEKENLEEREAGHCEIICGLLALKGIR
jgi:hypothetical protein